jgi:pyruvate kinase
VQLSAKGTRDEMIADAMRVAIAEGLIRSGDQVAILAGDGVGAKVTNNLRIAQVP